MNKGEQVVITRVANGFVAAPTAPNGEAPPEQILVFDGMERLTAWIAVHFSQAEPVKAPDADRCAHDWRPSLGKTPEMYCHKCGERKPA